MNKYINKIHTMNKQIEYTKLIHTINKNKQNNKNNYS